MNDPVAQRAAIAAARELADRIILRFQSRHPDPWGAYTLDLALEAMLTFDDATGETKYTTHVLDVAAKRGWAADKEVKYGSPPFTWLMFDVFHLSGDQRYVAWYVRQSDLYCREIPRSVEGAVMHPRRNGGYGILIDSLQEYASRMAKAGRLSGDESFFRECVDQYELHRQLLRDAKTGLYHQGRGWMDDPIAVSPGTWSRGQGWLIRGMVESLRYLPRESPYYTRMQTLLREHVDALLVTQAPDGMWHALPDWPLDRSAPESSGTAMIAFSLARAVCLQFLPEAPYAAASLRAAAALRNHVSNEGIVLSESPGPGPNSSLDGYLDAQFPNEGEHGPGAVIYGLAGEIMLRKHMMNARPR